VWLQSGALPKNAKKWPTIRAQCQRYILALLEVDKLPIELFYEIMGPETSTLSSFGSGRN